MTLLPQSLFQSMFILDDKADFNAHLKLNLLTYYRPIIYQYLKPQMGGFIDATSVGLSILNSERLDDKRIGLKCSVFYVEQIGGCNCNDEPHAENGYCEIRIMWNEEGIKIS